MQLSWTGLTVVRVPIGEEDWEVVRLRERLSPLQSPLPWLPILNHLEIASHLLAVAVSARPLFLTRTVPPRPEVIDTFRDWDGALEECFEQLFPPDTWNFSPDRLRVAHLPLDLLACLGGFGIRSAADLSPLSCAGGWCQTTSAVVKLGVVGEERMFSEFFRTPKARDLQYPWFTKALDHIPPAVR
ncbi:unnamed protein product [Closterium sp. NIES-53]